MIIDVRAMQDSDAKDFECVNASLELPGGYDATLLAVEACVRLTNIRGSIIAKGGLVAALKLVCCRCLEPVALELKLEFSEKFLKLAVSSCYPSAEKEAVTEDEYVFDGETLDISRAVRDNIILNIPPKTVCNDACKGLCQACGCNLNNETCSC